jgi:ferredoxin
MTYVIGPDCIDVKEQSCVAVCPVDCIHEVEQMLLIDPEECIDCAACVSECPVSAITPDDEVAPERMAFIAVNAAWSQPDQVAALLADALTQ